MDGVEDEAATGEDVEPEVAALFGPFVVLLPRKREMPQARTAPIRRVIASRLGKMPTTSVRRRISRLSRSFGLLDHTCRHTSLGKLVNARMSARASSRCSATAGSFRAGCR